VAKFSCKIGISVTLFTVIALPAKLQVVFNGNDQQYMSAYIICIIAKVYQLRES